MIIMIWLWWYGYGQIWFSNMVSSMVSYCFMVHGSGNGYDRTCFMVLGSWTSRISSMFNGSWWLRIYDLPPDFLWLRCQLIWYLEMPLFLTFDAFNSTQNECPSIQPKTSGIPLIVELSRRKKCQFWCLFCTSIVTGWN